MTTEHGVPHCATCPALEGSILAGCPTDILRALSHLKELSRTAEGDVLFAQGTPVDFIHCQHTGRFALLRRDGRDEEHLLTVTRPGEGLGAADLIQGDPHTYSAVALEESTCCTIPANVVLSLVNLHPEIIVRVLKAICGNLADIEQRIERQAQMVSTP